MHGKHRFGLGLRKPYYADFLDAAPVAGGLRRGHLRELHGRRAAVRCDVLRRVRERHPVALHGVSMSIGSADGVRLDYLRRLRALVDAIEPLFVSDHLSWSRHRKFQLARPAAAAIHGGGACTWFAPTSHRAQEVLGRTMLLENPSSYMLSPGDMTEWEFLERDVRAYRLRAAARRQQHLRQREQPRVRSAGLSRGHPRAIRAADSSRGPQPGRELLIDTHDQPVPDSVWSLYAEALQRLGPVATMIERDDNIPPLAELLAELDVARGIAAEQARRGGMSLLALQQRLSAWLKSESTEVAARFGEPSRAGPGGVSQQLPCTVARPVCRRAFRACAHGSATLHSRRRPRRTSTGCRRTPGRSTPMGAIFLKPWT